MRLLALLLLVASPLAAGAQAVQIDSDHWYHLTNLHLKDGHQLTIIPAYTHPFMRTASGESGQRWIIRPLGGGRYSISDAFGRALSTSPSSEKPSGVRRPLALYQLGRTPARPDAGHHHRRRARRGAAHGGRDCARPMRPLRA